MCVRAYKLMRVCRAGGNGKVGQGLGTCWGGEGGGRAGVRGGGTRRVRWLVGGLRKQGGSVSSQQVDLLYRMLPELAAGRGLVDVITMRWPEEPGR